MNEKIRIILTIEVEIEPNGDTLEALRERAAWVATEAMDNGRFTGDGPAEITRWDSWIVDRPAR